MNFDKAKSSKIIGFTIAIININLFVLILVYRQKTYFQSIFFSNTKFISLFKIVYN